jgi:hypothetical protein
MRWLLDTGHVQIGEADVGGTPEALPSERRDSLVHAIRRLSGLARLAVMRLDLRRISRQWRENDLADAGRNIRDRHLDAVDKDAMRFLIAPGPERRMGDELLFDPGQDIRREIEDADNAAVGLDAIQVRAFAAVDERRS